MGFPNVFFLVYIEKCQVTPVRIMWNEKNIVVVDRNGESFVCVVGKGVLES
jgi:hypothetical protein